MSNKPRSESESLLGADYLARALHNGRVIDFLEGDTSSSKQVSDPTEWGRDYGPSDSSASSDSRIGCVGIVGGIMVLISCVVGAMFMVNMVLVGFSEQTLAALFMTALLMFWGGVAFLADLSIL